MGTCGKSAKDSCQRLPRLVLRGVRGHSGPRAGQPEIGDARGAVRVNDNVARLQIAVDERLLRISPRVVHRVQAKCNLLRPAEGLAWGERLPRVVRPLKLLLQ